MSKKKLIGIIVGCIIVIFVVLVIAIPTEPISPPSTTPPATEEPTTPPATEQPTPQPQPANFQVTNLVISPQEATIGEPIAVSAIVKNTGGSEGSHTVYLKLNGQTEAQREITLAKGTAQTVSFTITKNVAQNYNVAIDGHTGSFTLSQPATFEPITIIGAGDKTSPPFTVTTDEWIIEWSYIPDPEYPEFAVFGWFVYPRGETALYVESGMAATGETSGSTYSYAGPGEYYLTVTAANIKSWKVVIKPA